MDQYFPSIIISITRISKVNYGSLLFILGPGDGDDRPDYDEKFEAAKTGRPPLSN
jgi:hypothetical protein